MIADGIFPPRWAAVVQLSTLQFTEVARYLRKDAGYAGENRWDFLNALGAESPVLQVLVTPLMAGLARAISNPRPDELVGDLCDPAELCDFADRATLEAHLFDAFISAAYRPPARSRWRARQAEPWLVFLARHLEHTVRSPDLAWWQLCEATPRSDSRRAVGLVFGLATVLGFGLVLGLGPGIVSGFVFGLAIGPAFGSVKAPARSMRLGVRSLAGGLVLGLGGRVRVRARGRDNRGAHGRDPGRARGQARLSRP